MKHIKIFILLLIVPSIFLMPTPSYAQEATTEGTEFWVSFMGNGFRNNSLFPYLVTQLMISSKHDCTGYVTNPNTGWMQEFNVEANNITSIPIPEAEAYNETSSYERVAAKGLQIVTTDTVSVYCTNIATNSFDASYVLPMQALADEYIIQTYDQSTLSENEGLYINTADFLSSAFLIVATEDNTTVDIMLSARTMAGTSAGEEISITLQKGETYQVRSTNMGTHRDLSGSRVMARDCKKIAVFNGNTLTTVPNRTNGFDHIFEQAMPLRSWGKKFVVTQSMTRRRDFVKITSSGNDNIVKKNGQVLTTLQAYQSYSFELSSTEKSCYIETTAPSAIYLYNTTSSDDGGMTSIGDPSMLWISPVEQRMTEVTFSTFSGDAAHNSSINHHYVNIIVATEYTGAVYLDDDPIPQNQFETVAGNAQYSFIRKSISHRAHHIVCPHGFNAHIYGFDSSRGYAYMVGSRATDLSTTIVINDEIVNPNDTITNCQLDPITFEAEINLNNYALLWDFGDGTTSTENPVVHTYPDHQLYQTKLTVTSGTTPCGSGSSSNYTSVFIDSRSEPDMNYTDEICAGDFYSGYGFNNILIRHDTILTREQPGSLNPNCISHINVSITCYPTEPLTLTDQVCFSGPSTYTENGFNIHYDRPDTTYTVTQMMPNEFGCDRSVTMVLHISHLTEHEPDTITDCDYYTWPWNGETYYEKVSIDDTIADPETGCYEIGHLRLNLNYTPTPRLTYAEDDFYHNGDTIAVITNTEFFSFNYDFFVEDSLGHFSDWDSCAWQISKQSWMIEPFIKDEEPDRRYCKVYVAERNDDPVELSCTVYNSHCGPNIITQRFYLKSSFFAIDEQERVLISVYPNPTKGNVNIKAEGMQRLIVVNQLGQVVYHNEAESDSITLDMSQFGTGLYLLQIYTQNGIGTKRLSVTR